MGEIITGNKLPINRNRLGVVGHVRILQEKVDAWKPLTIFFILLLLFLNLI